MPITRSASTVRLTPLSTQPYYKRQEDTVASSDEEFLQLASKSCIPTKSTRSNRKQKATQYPFDFPIIPEVLTVIPDEERMRRKSRVRQLPAVWSTPAQSTAASLASSKYSSTSVTQSSVLPASLKFSRKSRSLSERSTIRSKKRKLSKELETTKVGQEALESLHAELEALKNVSCVRYV